MFAAQFRLVFVLACLMVLSSCGPTLLGPTVPSGYRLMLPAASQTARLRSLPLTVRLTDASGTPVDNVAVYFRIPEADAALAAIEPRTVLAQHGEATAVLQARAAGRVTVEITVEDVTAVTHIAILGNTPRL